MFFFGRYKLGEKKKKEIVARLLFLSNSGLTGSQSLVDAYKCECLFGKASKKFGKASKISETCNSYADIADLEQIK
jgi:hypothetical protein